MSYFMLNPGIYRFDYFQRWEIQDISQCPMFLLLFDLTTPIDSLFSLNNDIHYFVLLPLPLHVI